MESLKTTLKIPEESIFDETNGLVLNNYGLPEEMVEMILSYVDIKSVLDCKLVCKSWNEIIKSHHMWRLRLSDIRRTVKKDRPWYFYYCAMASDVFNKNLLKNGDAQDGFKHWEIERNGGEGWIIEETPVGCNPLPKYREDFNENSKCFVTSYETCSKSQAIRLDGDPLILDIIHELRPRIYVSEWICARFDCTSRYKLTVLLWNKDNELIFQKSTLARLQKWVGSPWKKVEIVCKDYKPDVVKITVHHQGEDSQFWQGHYGAKMPGGVVKLLFE